MISNHKFVEQFQKWKKDKFKTRPYVITVIDDGTSTNETRLGAVNDIKLAVQRLNLTDDLLVMAGDNILDFSLYEFIKFGKDKNNSCVMCYEENELKSNKGQQLLRLMLIVLLLHMKKSLKPKGNLAVPPFYFL